jgi:hypothetical protein
MSWACPYTLPVLPGFASNSFRPTNGFLPAAFCFERFFFKPEQRLSTAGSKKPLVRWVRKHCLRGHFDQKKRFRTNLSFCISAHFILAIAALAWLTDNRDVLLRAIFVACGASSLIKLFSDRKTLVMFLLWSLVALVARQPTSRSAGFGATYLKIWPKMFISYFTIVDMGTTYGVFRRAGMVAALHFTLTGM